MLDARVHCPTSTSGTVQGGKQCQRHYVVSDASNYHVDTVPWPLHKPCSGLKANKVTIRKATGELQLSQSWILLLHNTKT